MSLCLIPAGPAFTVAYGEALRFLREMDGLLLLKDGVGSAGERWLRDRFHEKDPLLFGMRIQRWHEWVRSQARSAALGEGKLFRELSAIRERQLFRETVQALAEKNAFRHVQEFVGDESFFSSLLENVKELRMSGIKHRAEVERASGLLDEKLLRSKASYDDLWMILAAYEARLQAEEPRPLDESDRLELALRAPNFPEKCFVLGAGNLSLLETDLLKEIAKRGRLLLPLLAEEEVLRGIAGAKRAAATPAEIAAEALVSFTQSDIEVTASRVSPPPKLLRHLEAHTEGEEIRALGAWAGEGEKLHPRAVFQILLPDAAFRSELSELLALSGWRGDFSRRTVLNAQAARGIRNILRMREENFSLSTVLEAAAVLESAGRLKSHARLAELAKRLGVRGSLGEWKRKGAGNELLPLVEVLERIDRLLPAHGPAYRFHEALEKLTEEFGFAELARLASTLDKERESHLGLAGLLRTSANFAASWKGDLSFEEWVRELDAEWSRTLLVEEREMPEHLRLSRYGEWIPPLGKGDFLMLAGASSAIEPKGTFSFYLDEPTRRCLRDFLLKTRLAEELGLLSYFQCLLGTEALAQFSHAAHDRKGKEQEESWVLNSFPAAKEPWPVAPGVYEDLAPLETPCDDAKFAVTPPERYTATFVEAYQSCPFLSLAGNLWRLEDRLQDPSLDVRRLDEGNLAHRALEIYYGELGGRSLKTAEERQSRLEEAFERAEREESPEYYLGTDSLFRVQMEHLRKSLGEFIEEEYKYFERNPEVEVLDCEWEFVQEIAGRNFKGVVDRIDVDTRAKRFLVVDYKLGSTPSTRDILEAKNLQVCVYLDAVEKRLGGGFEPIGALYAGIKGAKINQGLILKRFNRASKKDDDGEKRYFGFKTNTRAVVDDELFSATRNRARSEIGRIVRGVEEGLFPAVPREAKECAACAVRPACRIRERQQPWPQAGGGRPAFRAFFTDPVPQAGKNKKPLQFTERQNEALDSEGKLIFLEASAGTGKTTVIVEKVRRFLKRKAERGEDPLRAAESFAAATFTEKSAQELRLRISAMLLEEFGPELAAQALAQVSTIHGFCRKILAEFPREAGLPPMGEMMDEKASRELQGILFEEFFLKPEGGILEAMTLLFREYSRSEVQSMLETLLSSRSLLEARMGRLLEKWPEIPVSAAEFEGFQLPEEERKPHFHAVLSLFHAYCDLYDSRKRRDSLLDFHDLESGAGRALRHRHVREFYRKRLDLLLVDEFQDTNSLQRDILESAAREGWSNAFVVGDAKQSIYRFRDADVSVFQKLRKAASGSGSLFELDRNFRSQSHIVDFATHVSKSIFPPPEGGAPDFEATWAEVGSSRATGERVTLLEYELPEKANADIRRETEAGWLVRLIRRLEREGTPLSDIAVLFRKLATNDVYLSALSRAGIPFVMGSSNTFYKQVEVLDAVALARALDGEGNDLALLAFLRSPFVRLPDHALSELMGRKGQSLLAKLKESEAPLYFRLREKLRFSAFSEVMREAFRHYPPSRFPKVRLQLDKFVSIVAELEDGGHTRKEIVRLLTEWSGWESEDRAGKESSIAEAGGSGAVRILTVHASKGLEFPVVILPDLTGPKRNSSDKIRFFPSQGASIRRDEDADDDTVSVFKGLGAWNREREEAELKRLLYVALTRAKNKQYLLLPKVEGSDERNDWSGWIRKAGPSPYHEVLSADELLRDSPIASAGKRRVYPAEPASGGIPAKLPVRETSISEFAAYQYCPEFHRRKFVQGWDDRIVALWPADAEEKARVRKLAKRNGGADASREELGRLLRKLGIERKERGIALHRVLERVKDAAKDIAKAELWLKEAYVSQGVDPEAKELPALLERDRFTFEKLLSSPLGRELFSNENEAFPEIPFRWNLGGHFIHGTMDRLIRRKDRSWVVVDYKSSVLEESLERYRFQVASYAAAVKSRHPDEPVEAYLVDLLHAEADAVPCDHEAQLAKMQADLHGIAENYLLTEERAEPTSRGIKSSEACIRCPYALHCAVGREFVLKFT